MRQIVSFCVSLAIVFQFFGVEQLETKSVFAAARINYLGVSGKTYIGSTPPNPPNLASGLVGHWSFDGTDMVPNVRDKSGQGNHGVLSSGFATSAVTGILGQALNFDGSDDYVTITDHASLDQSSSYSVSAWVNADTLQNNSWDSIVTKGASGDGGGNDHNYLLGYNNNGGIGTTDRWLFLLENSSGTNCNLVGNAAATRGRWYFVTGVFDDAADLSQIYVDGVKQNEIACALTVNTNDRPVRIGDDEDAVGAPWDGKIDDVRIYSRALTASEVAQLYKLGANAKQMQVTTTPTNLQSGLVGHWTFDGPDMIPNVRDKSGQGRHGQLSGFTSTTSVPGRIGQAMNFDGIDDGVQMGAAAIGASSFSVATWVYVRSLSENTFGIANNGVVLFTTRNSNDEISPTLFISNNSGGVGTHTGALYACDSNLLGKGAKGATTISLGRWYHIVGTFSYSGSGIFGGTWNVYVNGVLDNAAANNFDVNVSATCGGSFTGTTWRMGNSNVFTGASDVMLDDQRVYNRALSAAEVLQLYNLGR